jgi:hypothetical protein
VIFGGGFFILLAERGVVPKEGLWMVCGGAAILRGLILEYSRLMSARCRNKAF